MGRGGQCTKLSREELYAQVWAEPMTKLAQRYGLSDRGLGKICARMGVPTPSRGHWARVASGRTPHQAILPAIRTGQLAVVFIDRRDPHLDITERSQEIAEAIKAESHPDNHICVPDELIDPHPLVEKTAKSLRAARTNDRSLVSPRAKQCLDIRVGKESVERALRIMDALVKALDARGLELVRTEQHGTAIQVVVNNESLNFYLEEKVRREPYQPTSAEQKMIQKDRFYSFRLPDYSYVSTGYLSLKLDAINSSGLRSTWTDGKKQRVEMCLNRFIAAAHQAAAYRKAARIKRGRDERERAEQQRRDAILRQQIEREQSRLDVLTEQVKAWHAAEDLRAYIQAVRGAGYYSRHSITDGRDIDQWSAWALEQANRLDPTVTSPPSVLDHKDRFLRHRRMF